MSTNRKTDKCIVVHSYNHILFSNKMRKTIAAPNHVNEPQEYPEIKNLVINEYILYYPIYTKFQEKNTYCERNQSSVCLCVGVDVHGCKEILWDGGNDLYFCSDGSKQAYSFLQLIVKYIYDLCISLFANVKQAKYINLSVLNG